MGGDMLFRAWVVVLGLCSIAFAAFALFLS